VIIKFDPSRLALPDLSDAVEQMQLGAEQLDPRLPLIAEAIETLQAAAGGQPVYASIGIPLSHAEWPVFFFLQQSPDVEQQRLQDFLRAIGIELTAVVRHGMIIMAEDGRTDLAKTLDALTVSPREQLDEAFASVASYPIQILLVPPDYIRRTVVELMPQLPRHLGGGSSDVLTEGLRWAALGLDPGGPRATLVVQSASPQAAQRLADHLPKMLQSVYDELPGFQQRVGRLTFAAWVALITPAIEDDRIVFRVGEDQPLPAHLQVLVAGLMGSIEDRLRGQDRRDSANRFKRILLAMHNYHDVYKMLPPRDEVRDEQGRSGLSWRVHLLPFLGEQNLYDEFRLDERWDSPHNKPLMERCPRSTRADGSTSRRAIQPSWPRSAKTRSSAGEGNQIRRYRRRRKQHRRAGGSQARAGRALDCAGGLRFRPESPGDGLWLDSDGRCLIGIADGSVHHARGDIPPSMLLRLFQKSDGHLVDWKLIR
jgi:hypothetical protein